jgi:hypothetical protein
MTLRDAVFTVAGFCLGLLSFLLLGLVAVRTQSKRKPGLTAIHGPSLDQRFRENQREKH